MPLALREDVLASPYRLAKIQLVDNMRHRAPVLITRCRLRLAETSTPHDRSQDMPLTMDASCRLLGTVNGFTRHTRDDPCFLQKPKITWELHSLVSVSPPLPLSRLMF